jgi:hypothetical protein
MSDDEMSDDWVRLGEAMTRSMMTEMGDDEMSDAWIRLGGR